ncbi:MAG: 50S ribosomal protein L6 [Planctomycetes bacterium]|nr:50S ribosomal protein L6 [Planctomycetota bacterium]
MSRIGKQPVVIPAGVKVTVEGSKIRVEASKDKKLELQVHPNMKVESDGKVIKVSRPDDERQNRALHGLTRSLINNMVLGVTKGYEKRLKVEGIGYQAKIDKKAVVLMVGYSNPIVKMPPEGVTVECPDVNTIIIKGADKQAVGQFAAEVRAVRKPEPYKGKGIMYEGEKIRRKEGKSFASGAT